MMENQSMRWLPLLLAVLLLPAFSTPIQGQDDPNGQRSELGVRQKLVQLKMLEIERKFTVIADRLRETQPKQAELLVAAYQKSKEELITSKMELVTEQLNNNRFEEAKATLDDVSKSLDSIVGLLTQRKDKQISKQEEMEQLERWKKQIQDQIKEQKEQRVEAEKISNKDQTLQKLAASIKKLEGLIQKQNELIKETQANKDAPLRDLDRVADKQFQIRKETQELKDEIGKLAGDNQNKPGEGKPGEGKPGEGKPGEGKPGEGKPGEGKPGEGKPGEEKTR